MAQKKQAFACFLQQKHYGVKNIVMSLNSLLKFDEFLDHEMIY